MADLIVVLFVADRFAILALVAGRLLLGHRLLVGDQLVFIVLVLVLFVVLSGAAGRPALAALLGQLLLAVLDVVERGAEEALEAGAGKGGRGRWFIIGQFFRRRFGLGWIAVVRFGTAGGRVWCGKRRRCWGCTSWRGPWPCAGNKGK